MFELDHDGVFRHKEYPSSWFTLPTDPRDPYFRCKFQQAFESVLMIAVNVKENKEGEFKKFQRTVVKRSPEQPFPNSTIYEGHLFGHTGSPLANSTPVSSQLAFYSFFRLIKYIWDCPILKQQKDPSGFELLTLKTGLILLTNSFNLQPPIYAAFLYDAVYQYAIALNTTIANNEEPNGGNIISKLLNIEYNSESKPFLSSVINL